MAVAATLLGSIDANRGDPQNCWDTDQNPSELYDCVHGIMVVLGNGGPGSGRLNFGAKVGGEFVDTFARGLLVVERVLADSRMAALRAGRYASFDPGDGERFENGELGLAELRDIAANGGEPTRHSGRQELVENIINDHLFTVGQTRQ